ncbi:cytochrome P450 [Zychaea mexicana]|uniref:cytochrome P450 n=1 Tax=Zychaea mexicana TaxID=64656 RepID=UPI0022FE518E|nr:cytochrome P450 [Zychaea mexicana]KAI9490119.1 cytochrome P450 [Zychaea mexicana]
MDQLIQIVKIYIVPRLKHNKRSISAATAAILAVYYVYQKINRPPRSLRHIPYVNGFETISALLNKEPLDDVTDRISLPLVLKTKHGMYSRITPAGWQVVISDPAIAKQYLFDSNTFPKVPLNKHFEDTVIGRFIIGPNILFLSGQHWKNQRKVANPAFHRSMPLALFGRLTENLFQVIDKSDGKAVDAYDLMERWTLDAIGNASFGFDFGSISDSNNQWVHRYNDVVEATSDPIYAFFPVLERKYLHWFPKRKRIHDELTVFLDMIQHIIDEKRRKRADSAHREEKKEKDLLEMMMESGEDDGNGLTDEELKSNLCVFFFAGHDTTASALSFAIYYLAKHPELQERAREEAYRVLGNEPKDIGPTVEQSRQMTYIDQIIKEVLRIEGPADSLISRNANKDTELGGVVIPKGTAVTVSLYNLHRNPRVWDNPDKFDPERFASGGEADFKDANAWIPFSTGSRQCIGMNFSMSEQRFLLPMLLRKYKWTLPKDTIHDKKIIIELGLGVISPINFNVIFEKLY